MLKWTVGRGWNNIKEHDSKSQDGLEQTVSRNTDVKHPTGEGSEGSEEHGKENTNLLRAYLSHSEQTTSRATNVKGAAGEDSEGNEEHVIGKLERR